ncbi:MAG: dTDP-4-dehydrorhamnose 3,5-epimerase [Alphaproteobacteria bacterium]
MEAERLKFADVVCVVVKKHQDSRGYFTEMFVDTWFRENVANVTFIQENQSLSVSCGTIRGLHFQTPSHAQDKLVWCSVGAIFDVVVDLRQGSPTFGQWMSQELSSDNGRQLWIPAGFAHGFCTLAPNTLVSYKVTSAYNSQSDRGITWNDSTIGIAWPPVAKPETLSAKDLALPTLENLPPNLLFA